MASTPETLDVYLEVGAKRVVAGALQWPGWCRVGHDEEAALQALAEYRQRYGRAISSARLGFSAPADPAAFKVVERLEGNATTDYGVPGLPPTADKADFDEAELKRSERILRACWRALDTATTAAEGKELRKGPRGGGRELEKIIRHVLEAERGYLGSLARKPPKAEEQSLEAELERTREAVLEALAAAQRGEIPERGPRGGTIWPARYFVRRVAWHALDHVWEIEDRVEE